MPDQETLRRHWIYIPGGEELLHEAYAWQRRKIAQGKWYRVIDPASMAEGDELRQVANNDVLYIFASSVTALQNPKDLAACLQTRGLDRGHRELKVFASHSADTPGSAEGAQTSFVESLYEAMRADYPELVVYGYSGDVTTDGFSGHKSAGLKPGETLEPMSETEWSERQLRASENRIRFPPDARVH